MSSSVQTRNNISRSGAGARPMMFAHGFGCSQTIWRLVAPTFLASQDVILFDYVGAGNSDHQAYSAQRYGDLAGYAQDVLDICEALDLHKIVFVGHSISAMIGILAAIRAPERFERLILVGASACYINDPPDYFGGWSREDIAGLLDLMQKNYDGWANFLAPLVMKNDARPELAAELKESFLTTNPVIAHEFARVTFYSDSRQHLPQLTVPALVLQPSEDIIVPRSATEYI